MNDHRLLSAVAVLVLAVACSDETAPVAPPQPATGAPWAPTTTPFDPTCAACTEIGAGAIAHVGETQVMVDTTTDDPPAQWGRCVFAFVVCLDDGGEIPDCIRGAPCPAPCKSAFEAELGGSADFEVQVLAMDRVFFDEGAVCAPPPEEVAP